MDADSGKVLFSENESDRALIASTTKIMTAVVVLEQCDTDAVVTVREDCTGIEGSSIYLAPGEKITVRELLYGLMLESGNDAAEALAVYTAGSIDGFSHLMNVKAEEIGLDDTYYKNPHGLDCDGHYSTALDLALLMRYAISIPEFVEICGTKSITFGDRTFVNHNKLLWKDMGVYAGKTGYTDEAGRILVTCCQREGLDLICVTLNDRNDWQDHCDMYEWGFSNYHFEKYADRYEFACKIDAVSNETIKIPVLFSSELTAFAFENDIVEIKIELPKFVYAPLKFGDRVGEALLVVNGDRTASVELIAGADVAVCSVEDNVFSKLAEYLRDIMSL